MARPTTTGLFSAGAAACGVAATFRLREWKRGAAVRLLGVQASSLEAQQGQMSLLEEEKTGRWKKALTAADRLRDKFGESAVSLGTAVKGSYRERAHENPAGLPGRRKRK
jgi:hypothetical protein